MKLTVNNTPLELHRGARVKDAIVSFYTQSGRRVPKRLPPVEDRFGNRVAHDGELSEGNALFIVYRRRKRAASMKIIVAVLATALLSACGTARHTGATTTDENHAETSPAIEQHDVDSPASELHAITSPAAKKPADTNVPSERQAVIFAVNDMHAAIDNFPKLAWIVDSLKAIYPDMLLVAAGDNQTGNPVNDQFPEKGWPMIDLMNATGFDLSAVGNHEFDTGPEGFGNLTGKANFSFICANVLTDCHPTLRISPYRIITLPNGLRLAFLGLLQLGQNGIPDTHPDNAKAFSFRSPFETAPEYLWLKDSSDIFIALTHIGFEEDIRLAETMSAGIDLIIGGHSHTRVEKEQKHNGIIITQAENKLKYGTLIRLTVSGDGAVRRSMQLIDIRNSKKESPPAIRAMVDRYNDNPVLNEVIATATDDFSSYEELGYLMADAQREAAGADIALMNPGGVRIDRLEKGPVSIKNVYQLDPFGNELVVTKLTGEEIYSLMRAAWPVDDRSPLLPSGIRTELKLDAEGNPLEFIIHTEDGNPLDPDRIYTVAMNSYITQVYDYEHADPGQSLFFTTAEALINHLKKQGDVRSYRDMRRVTITR
ncbi:MAG: bifunctional UDP-sugar hydrolase/5'-nucleotidase [Bacteroidales bacterium]|nr:bifunctional UDP-sugar hydrolase/5'-nucleotidase [Bacteroidales bacterium]MDT8373273.1 bifunctional UDP-sugar hydrolase/5'-nucleotidase [Bacteroidales bacterium]